MSTTEWDRQALGTVCPFDHPRPATTDHWDWVATLKASSLYLGKNQTYRGHCSLILDTRHAVRPDQLSAQEWTAFCSDLHVAVGAIMRTVTPDHVNIESLGNVVPHLHWHIVPRYKHDPRWGLPIWTTPLAAVPDTRLDPVQHAQLLSQLRDALAV